MTMAIFRRPSLLILAALAGCAASATRDSDLANRDLLSDAAAPSVASASTADSIPADAAGANLLRPVAALRVASPAPESLRPAGAIPAGFTQDQDPAVQAQIRNWLEQGAFLEGQGQYEEALRTYSQILALDKDNRVVLDRIRKLQRIQGERTQNYLRSIDDAIVRERLANTYNKALAMQRIEEAQLAIGQGDYDEALTKYEQALTLVKLYSMIQDDNLNELALQRMIETTKAKRAEADREELNQKAIQADEAAQRAREEELARDKSEIERLMQETRVSFRNRHYDDAEKAVKRVLYLRPDTEGAQDLLENIRQARFEQEAAKIREEFAYNWKIAMAQINQSDIPQQSVIWHRDLEHWREVAARSPLTLGEEKVARDERDLEIERRMDSVMIIPKEIPDAEVPSDTIKNISRRIGVDVKVSYGPDGEEPAVTSAKEHLGLVGGPMTATEWLKLLPNTPSRLHFRVRNGIIQLQPEAAFYQGNMVLRFYEVKEIVRNAAYYPTKDVNLSAPGADEMGAGEEEIPEVPLIASGDSLPELVTTNTGGASVWDDIPGTKCDFSGGILTIRHTPEMHARVAELLDSLRGVTRLMVDIQSRFLKVEDNFLEDIGIDLRGLGDDSGGEGLPGRGTEITFDDFGDNPGSSLDPGPLGSSDDPGVYFRNGSNGDILGRTEHLFDRSLGNDKVLTGSGGFSAQYTLLDDTEIEAVLRAVSKSERTELVTAPRLLVFDTERANISVLNQISYVQDFDVEIAQAAAIADPIIDVISDGVILDVTPIVSADRRFITLELRPTVAILERPIPEFTTTLGVGSPVTIQLPSLEIQRIRTTVNLPDGGTLMLGGQQISEKQDYQSGIPILSDLPVLSFFFSRKGRYTSNRRLLILLKATIVIPEEHEPDTFQGTGQGSTN